MKHKMKKYIKPRHRFFFWAARPIARTIARKQHFKIKKQDKTEKPLKLEKGQNYLILSNHQNLMDPSFISLHLKRPIYFVATDSLYSKKWYLRLLFYCFGPIKKRKGFTDVACIRTMCQVAKEGGNVAVFPEGNRQWNDSQFYIDRAVVKLVRMLKLPLVLYNFHGGYGVKPRWGKSLRKGKYTGEVREIISLEELCAMSDDQLYEKIVSELKVIDSDSGELYKSDERAEYLERELFVCPKCGKSSTLHSQGSEIRCDNCDLTVTYGENLHLTSSDPDFHFDKLVDWYEYQQQYVRDYDLESADVLLSDENVELYDKTGMERIFVASGKLTLSKSALSVGEWQVSTSEIFAASAQGGKKISFGAGDKSYIIAGSERFNGIKYLLFFNRVCSQIAQKGGDKYYGLYLDPARR